MSSFAYFPGPNPYLPPKQWFLLLKSISFYFLSKKKSTKLLSQLRFFLPERKKFAKQKSAEKRALRYIYK